MIKYSLTGEDATARQFRDIRKTQTEYNASVANSINPMIQYLTGGDGIASSSAEWKLTGKTSTTNNQAQPVAYDPTYDPTLTITVPKSGRISVQVQAWLYAGSYANSGDVNSAVGIYFRLGVLPVFWYEGTAVPSLPAGAYGGCQIAIHNWGQNVEHDVGMNSQATINLGSLVSHEKLNIRAQRYYWAVAYKNDGSAIPMPANSWYTGTIGSISMQVIPVYSNTEE